MSKIIQTPLSMQSILAKILPAEPHGGLTEVYKALGNYEKSWREIVGIQRRENDELLQRRQLLSDSEGVVVCPSCGGNNLHQNFIEVFNRNEDASTGLHVTVRGEGIEVDADVISRNPSDRRQGIRIFFECESCTSNSPLVIIQHKGCTYVRWE